MTQHTSRHTLESSQARSTQLKAQRAASATSRVMPVRPHTSASLCCKCLFTILQMPQHDAGAPAAPPDERCASPWQTHEHMADTRAHDPLGWRPWIKGRYAQTLRWILRGKKQLKTARTVQEVGVGHRCVDVVDDRRKYFQKSKYVTVRIHYQGTQR